MPKTSPLPPFAVFPSESGRPTIRVPLALASVEHEGTTWLLRSYNGLLFFKREADTQGEALFVLTETLADPTPDAAIELWKRCFSSDDWARFGVRDWEGGYDWEYFAKVQHDMCFLLANPKEDQPSGFRITTDLSYNGEYGNGGMESSPEGLGVGYQVATFLSLLITDFMGSEKFKKEDHKNILLNSSFNSLTSDFVECPKQANVLHHSRNTSYILSRDKKIKGWVENLTGFPLSLTQSFPVHTNISIKVDKNDFKSIIQFACYMYFPSDKPNIKYLLSFSSKSPFLPPNISQIETMTEYFPDDVKIARIKLDNLESFQELCSIILDYFEPTGHTYKVDNYQSFGSFAPQEVRFKFVAPSAQKKAKAKVQLRRWLEGKIEDAQIEKLLSFSA